MGTVTDFKALLQSVKLFLVNYLLYHSLQDLFRPNTLQQMVRISVYAVQLADAVSTLPSSSPNFARLQD